MFLGVSFFYLSPLSLINFCDCSEGVVLWVILRVCTMVL